jgi:hypothetical protein
MSFGSRTLGGNVGKRQTHASNTRAYCVFRDASIYASGLF